MKKVSASELAGILNGNLDFVLESYVLAEGALCSKPIYKFMEAYADQSDEPDFCAVYCEADDPGEIYVSVSSKSPDKFDGIIRGFAPREITRHGNAGSGQFRRSFYRSGAGKKQTAPGLDFMILSECDKNLKKSFAGEPDCYLETIFANFVEKKIYTDCAVIGICDKGVGFVGYLAYYGIAENIRDVSYVYIGESHRGKGYGRALLDFFADRNANEGKISYYSFADGEASENLAKSCGFLPCALRRSHAPDS